MAHGIRVCRGAPEPPGWWDITNGLWSPPVTHAPSVAEPVAQPAPTHPVQSAPALGAAAPTAGLPLVPQGPEVWRMLCPTDLTTEACPDLVGSCFPKADSLGTHTLRPWLSLVFHDCPTACWLCLSPLLVACHVGVKQGETKRQVKLSDLALAVCMELLLLDQDTSVLGKPVSLPPQVAQDTCPCSCVSACCLKSVPLSSCSPVPAPERDAPGAVAPSSSGDLDKY